MVRVIELYDMMKNYSEADIQVLTDHEHIRIRPAMYIGQMSEASYEVPVFTQSGALSITTQTFVPSVFKCLGEILDNSIDEHVQNDNRKTRITITSEPLFGTYTVTDNGRGIPIGKHSSGKHAPEVAFGSLKSGRNFSNDKESGVIGMNGIGSSAVCAVSASFDIEINRDGKKYTQSFANGASRISPPSIVPSKSKQTGTSVSFQLDSDIFDNTTLPDTLLENKAIEIAMTNPGVTAVFNGKEYKFRRGFDQVIKSITTDYFKFKLGDIEFYVVFDQSQNIDEKVFTWVNSSLLFDGGICNTQFLNAFYDRVETQLLRSAKKNKCTVTKNDIRQNLLIFGVMKIANPEYDAQSKTRLTGPNLRKEMSTMVSEQWPEFVRGNKPWLEIVLDRAVQRHHNSANRKAIKDHSKNMSKKVQGLIDATSKDRSECQLFITEGLSAASSITQSRNPRTIASLPLTGKLNNVYGSTAAQLLNMGKITDLLTAIGLVPGQKALRSTLRYNRIVIAVDSDLDGNHIFALLVNLLYQFWPELFDPEYEPIVYQLMAPNVCLTKGKKRIHFNTMQDYEAVSTKYNNTWTVTYYKGLGSMEIADWEMIFSDTDNNMIPFVGDDDMSATMKLLFGPNAEARKEWLQSITDDEPE